MTRLILVAGVAVLIASSSVAEEPAVKVGIPKSAFRDLPPALLSIAGEPFKALMKSQTGLDGDVSVEADALAIARQIDDGKLQLGVFLGHEFAWAKDKYPNLEPLVVAVPRPREVHAVLLVRWDCKAAHLGELKGTKLVLARYTRDHARLFFEREKAAHLSDGSFSSTEKVDTAHDAIQKLLEGDADVTVVDGAAWSYFQKLFPGPSENLKVLAKSEVFPPTVVAYKKGSLDDATAARLRSGLLTAHEASKGAKLMNLIRLERFDEVPTGYDDLLKGCRKAYPTPLADK